MTKIALNFRIKALLVSTIYLVLFISSLSYASDNYFHRIAMVSDGRITRFNKFPITVYVEGLEVQGKKYAPDLRYAMKEWAVSSNDTANFKLVESADGADILVSWVRTLESDDYEHPLGVTELQRIDDDKFHITMQIALRDRKTYKPLTHEQMKTVFLHELGHAIGLWGHSQNKSDVMYYAANALLLTPADIETLKLVYSHEPNYSLHEETIKTIKKDMRTKLEDARLYFMLGTVYADQENYDEAINNFKRCLHLNPGFYKASSALALAYQNSGQEEAALTEFIALSKSKPSAMVYNVIGALYFGQGDALRAIQHLKKSLELERTYRPAKENLRKVYLSKGKECINAGMHQEAVSLLLEAISIFPDEPELHNSLGTAYTEAKQFQKAINEYNKALQINPAFAIAKSNLASCYNNLGVQYAKMEMWDRAIVEYNYALRIMPDMTEANKNISTAYWDKASGLSKAGRNKAAIEAYKNFLKYKPNSKEAYNNLGAVYFRTDDYESAVAAFEAALRIDPKDNGFRDNLAIAHHKHGIVLMGEEAIPQAIAAFEKGLKIAPNNAGLYRSMAQAHQRLGQWQDVEFYIGKAEEIEPNSEATLKMVAAINIQRGNQLLQAKKYKAALARYNKVPAEVMPASLYNNIGYIYIMQGKIFESVAEFDRVLAIDPLNKIAHQNLINVEGRLGQAFSQNQDSQKARSNLAQVRLSLALSYMRQSHLTAAKSSLKSAIDLDPRGNMLRRSLADGCKELADAFTKRENGRAESREIKNWETFLKSR